MNISKDFNEFVGDKTGRTVSRRTAHGLKNVTGGGMSDEGSEDIVHAGMIASAVGIVSKNPKAQATGALGAALLFFLYHAGRDR